VIAAVHDAACTKRPWTRFFIPRRKNPKKRQPVLPGRIARNQSLEPFPDSLIGGLDNVPRDLADRKGWCKYSGKGAFIGRAKSTAQFARHPISPKTSAAGPIVILPAGPLNL
jgi:hypothetical protein